MIRKLLLSAAVAVALISCGDPNGPAPEHQDNACSILQQRPGWYSELAAAEQRWGIRPSVVMAIVWKESSYRARARPREESRGSSLPGKVRSSAYGYSQALDGTWDWYTDSTGEHFRRRDNFGDSADFIGWYANESLKRCGIDINDAYNQYLAYHQGHGGYNRGSYQGMNWLLQVARQVDNMEAAYRAQLPYCDK